MPTCKFYLLGMCGKNDCPYLHKKVTAKTSICIDFLKGYCERAAEVFDPSKRRVRRLILSLRFQCPKRHEFLCPEFEKQGECKVTRCPYPHRNHESYTPKDKSSRRKRTVGRTHQRHADADDHTDDMNAKRYFIESSDQSQSTSNEATDSSAPDKSDGTILVVRKPKLGALPSYIPLG